MFCFSPPLKTIKREISGKIFWALLIYLWFLYTPVVEQKYHRLFTRKVFYQKRCYFPIARNIRVQRVIIPRAKSEIKISIFQNPVCKLRQYMCLLKWKTLVFNNFNYMLFSMGIALYRRYPYWNLLKIKNTPSTY